MRTEANKSNTSRAVPGAMPLRLEWRTPGELDENPHNWREHPEAQLAALTDVMGEVGWAGACLFNERTGRLIDGHARRNLALNRPNEKIPVLVGSWDESTEKKILATLDPLAAMAESNAVQLAALLREIEPSDPAIEKMLADLADAADLHGLKDLEEGEREIGGDTRSLNDRGSMINCLVYMSDVAVFEKAMHQTGRINRAEALAQICQSYLNGP